jgi:hypothetical protein
LASTAETMEARSFLPSPPTGDTPLLPMSLPGGAGLATLDRPCCCCCWAGTCAYSPSLAAEAPRFAITAATTAALSIVPDTARDPALVGMALPAALATALVAAAAAEAKPKLAAATLAGRDGLLCAPAPVKLMLLLPPDKASVVDAAAAAKLLRLDICRCSTAIIKEARSSLLKLALPVLLSSPPAFCC